MKKEEEEKEEEWFASRKEAAWSEGRGGHGWATGGQRDDSVDGSKAGKLQSGREKDGPEDTEATSAKVGQWMQHKDSTEAQKQYGQELQAGRVGNTEDMEAISRHHRDHEGHGRSVRRQHGSDSRIVQEGEWRSQMSQRPRLHSTEADRRQRKP